MDYNNDNDETTVLSNYNNGNDETTVLSNDYDYGTYHQNPYNQGQAGYQQTPYDQNPMNYQQIAYDQDPMNYQQIPYGQDPMNYQQIPYGQDPMNYQQNSYDQNQINYPQNSYSQQQADYQQMIQQQEMINQMLLQQQQLINDNQRLQSDLHASQQKGEAPQIRVINVTSLIAAALCILPFFAGYFFRGDYFTGSYSLLEFVDEIKQWSDVMDNGGRFYTWVAGLLPICLIALIITCLIGGFIHVRTYKIVAIVLTSICAFVMLALIVEEGDGMGHLGGAWIFLFVGLVTAGVSVPTEPVKTLNLIGIENYAYENRKRSSDNTSIWRCSKCGTRCTGSVCKTCGQTRQSNGGNA